MEENIRKSRATDEYSLKLFETYNVRQLKQLPLYNQCVARYNNMKRFCRENEGITMFWKNFSHFYYETYPLFKDKFADPIMVECTYRGMKQNTI